MDKIVDTWIELDSFIHFPTATIIDYRGMSVQLDYEAGMEAFELIRLRRKREGEFLPMKEMQDSTSGKHIRVTENDGNTKWYDGHPGGLFLSRSLELGQFRSPALTI